MIMARRTYEQHEAAIVAVIQKFKIRWVIDIFEHYRYLRHSQFYNLGLDKSELIKNALMENIESRKASMRDRWADPDANPTLQLAAYKLMATPEERDALATTSKIDAKVEADAGLLVSFKK